MTGHETLAGARASSTGSLVEEGVSRASRDRDGIGASAQRPDGILKVTGAFAYASDLWMDGMLWGVTLRSPHPYARILRVDLTAALATPGVFAVLTHEDVPGDKHFGLEHQDQPVLAVDVVRYQGEPVALVAADHPETARRAVKRIVVEYDVLEPVVDAVAALDPDSPRLHPHGNLVRHVKVRTGDPHPTADVVVSGDYQVGMQDQAFLGPESGLAVPDGVGGVDLHVATQWLHVDQRQVCSALGLTPDRVRLHLAGVGGAFGGREDLSMHVHGCLLALHTGRPVKMVYDREESFFGHVHRHPASMHYEYGADRDGRLVYARAEVHLDGGAYASSTPAVVGNAGTMGLGPYTIPHIHMDCYGVYTNNPPCGAMRGFGSVQTAFAVEAIMDRLADAVGLDPVEIRVRNGFEEGSSAPTGQVIDSAAPVAELVQRLRAMPMPAPERHGADQGAEQAGSTCAGCRAGCRTARTARACAAGSATRWPTRTSASRRASTTTRPRGSGSRSWPGMPSRRCTPPRPRWARASSRSSSRSAAPSSAWTGWWSHPRTPRSAPPARAPPPARPTSPGVRSGRRARACGGSCSSARRRSWAARPTSSGWRTATSSATAST